VLQFANLAPTEQEALAGAIVSTVEPILDNVLEA
jgi:hypothetical protein